MTVLHVQRSRAVTFLFALVRFAAVSCALSVWSRNRPAMNPSSMQPGTSAAQSAPLPATTPPDAVGKLIRRSTLRISVLRSSS
jgi:hypothetical protein